MTADDWQEVNAIWRERSPGWQCCVATLLASVAPEQAVPWLFEIIEAGDDTVALHAIDELREMQRAHSLISPWPPHVLRRVRDLWGRHRAEPDLSRRRQSAGRRLDGGRLARCVAALGPTGGSAPRPAGRAVGVPTLR